MKKGNFKTESGGFFSTGAKGYSPEERIAYIDRMIHSIKYPKQYAKSEEPETNEELELS